MPSSIFKKKKSPTTTKSLCTYRIGRLAFIKTINLCNRSMHQVVTLKWATGHVLIISVLPNITSVHVTNHLDNKSVRKNSLAFERAELRLGRRRLHLFMPCWVIIHELCEAVIKMGRRNSKRFSSWSNMKYIEWFRWPKKIFGYASKEKHLLYMA